MGAYITYQTAHFAMMTFPQLQEVNVIRIKLPVPVSYFKLALCAPWAGFSGQACSALGTVRPSQELSHKLFSAAHFRKQQVLHSCLHNTNTLNGPKTPFSTPREQPQ